MTILRLARLCRTIYARFLTGVTLFYVNVYYVLPLYAIHPDGFGILLMTLVLPDDDDDVGVS